jgi:4a-hydroxytetrahydrobiopterin dehydratase
MPSHILQKVIELTAERTALSKDMVASQLQHLKKWQVDTRSTDYCLTRTFDFETFEQATRFVHEIGKQTKNTKHLPILEVKKLGVTVTVWSPEVRGLHQSDFIVAATCDEIYDNWEAIIGEYDVIDVTSAESFPASDSPNYSSDDPS